VLLAAGCAAACHARRDPVAVPSPDEPYRALVRDVARAIEALKPDYPQLAEFSAAQHTQEVGQYIGPNIVYTYRCGSHPPGPGWMGRMPDPKADGVWIHIELHDPASQTQWHRQPVVPRFRFRDKSVIVILHEGANTRSLRRSLWYILAEHGVVSDGFWKLPAVPLRPPAARR
jgi:hypothetical protein